LPQRSLNALWGFVLIVALTVPSMNLQLTIDRAGIAWVRYANGTLVVMAFACVVFGVVFFLSGRQSGVALRITASTVLVFFLWPFFQRFDVIGGPLGALLVVLPSIVMVWAVAAYGDRSRVALTMVGLAALILVGVLYQVSNRGVGEPVFLEFAQASSGVPATYDDVLIVLADGYARDDVLRSEYGFDNSGFLEELSTQGFAVNPSMSANYTRTYASLGSVMALEYPVPTGEVDDSTEARLRLLMQQSGSLVHSFKEAGYEITVAETAWFGSHCGPFVDHCWREGTTRSSAYYLSLLTPLAPLVQGSVAHPFHATSWRQLRDLSAVFATAAHRDTPQMMFVHLDLPHPPLNLDASCNQRYESWRHGLILTADSNSEQSALRRAAFVEQTQCVNATLVQQLDQVLSAFPDTAILLFSDHGPDGQGQLWDTPDQITSEASAERLAVLSAARTRDRCIAFDTAVSLVNAVRGFTGCVLGLDIASLPDRAYWVPPQSSIAPVEELELAHRTP
jgi:hypothetical protein